MSDYLVTLETPYFTTSADTTDPAGPSAGFGLTGPVACTWQTDTVPPTAQPATVTCQLYDDGLNYIIGGVPTFVPLNIGDPASFYGWVTDTDGTIQTIAFQGRVSDVSATLAERGGVVYRITLADLLADVANATSPVIANGVTLATGGIRAFYEQVMAVESWFVLDWSTGNVSPDPFPAQTVEFKDWGQRPLLEVLSNYITHDVRPSPGPTTSRWLTYEVDEGDNTPIAGAATYRLNEYDPDAVSELAGALVLVWSGTQWELFQNLDYYTDGGTGLVIDAAQIVRDVGEWRKQRIDNINRVDLLGLFDTGPSGGTFPTGPYVETVRASFPDLETSQGLNSRSLDSALSYRVNARTVVDLILGPRSQISTDYSPTQIVTDWSLLSADQKTAWGADLWPIADNPALGRPIAVTGVPNEWRLTPGPAVVGRVMATSLIFELAQPSTDGGTTDTGTVGRVSIAWTIRGLAITGVSGSLTWDDLSTYSPVPTWDTLDPTIRWQDLALVED